MYKRQAFYGACFSGGSLLDRRVLLKKAIFAVCDPEKEYAHNFMEYLNQKQSHPYEIQAFSSVDVLTEYAQKHHIEILLIRTRPCALE